MKVDVVMPQMGESIAEGTIAKWLKKAGEKVERDESLLEITTDKVDSEVPSPESGVLSEIVVEEGETVEVGEVLARIETDAEAADEAAEEAGAEEEKKEAEEDKGAAAVEEEEKEEETEEAKKRKKEKKEKEKKEKAAQGAEEEKEGEAEEESPEREPAQKSERGPAAFFSPVVRNIARKEGISEKELQKISGSGYGGRVTKDDVLEFLETRESEKETVPAGGTLEIPKLQFSYDPDRVEIIQMSTVRKKIAEHMVYSKHVSPHTYNAAEVDMTRIVRFREREKKAFEKEEGFKLTYTPFILHATVLALKDNPMMNSSVEGDRIIRKEDINLGVAVAVENGLLVPVIRQADEKNLLGLARASWDLAARAREKRLKPEEIQGGTFTVTNPGVFGNIFGFPIINQPQVGILGVGAVRKMPVVVEDDAIAVRSRMIITLSYDHRVIDGAAAARFIQEVRANLEDYDLEQAL